MLKNKSQGHKVTRSPFDFAQGKQVTGLYIALFGFVFVFISLSYCWAQAEFKYDAKGKRNPFIPLVTHDGKLLKLDTDESTQGMAIEGIIYDKNGISYAIINGAVVKVSDMVGDSQVLKIEKNKVILIKDGEISEIELKKGDE